MNAFVLINASSGSCSVEDEVLVTSLLTESGLEVTGSWCGGGEGLTEAFNAIEAASPHTLIVLGGDGTIRTAIERCRPFVKNFILLPGGTMNLLVRAIYGEKNWKEILSETLLEPHEKTISSGKIGDKEFYVAAVLGTPTLLAHTREAIRLGDVGAAVAHSTGILSTPFITFTYESRTESGAAETLLVTTPLVSDVLHNEAKALDVAAVSIPGAFESLRILSAAALGLWRNDQNVSSHTAKSISVHAEELIPATLDGEPLELQKNITIEFVPSALTVLVPKPKVHEEG